MSALLRHRSFGREVPADQRPPVPDHLAPFQAFADHAMLELEPPRHTRLRGLVLRAFTSRRIAALAPEIEALCHRLIDALPDGEFDLLPQYAQTVPVTVIARLLGVPEEMAPQFLDWSNRMVAMHQARRDRAIEEDAAAATVAFSDYLTGLIAARRDRPGDDLLSSLIAAEAEGEKLSQPELIATCIQLLNAGHEATVHSIGNGVKLILEQDMDRAALAPGRVAATVEEILRVDPPLHLFDRYCYAETELFGQVFRPGDRVACLLAAANRDPEVYAAPARFDPARYLARPAPRPGLGFGAGIHFCVGAPLARLELEIALPVLFDRLPGLALAEPPRYADVYHFHGLERVSLRR